MPDKNPYTQGARVWIPHQEKGWEAAVILEDFEEERPQLVVQPDGSSDRRILRIESKALLPPLHLPRDCQLDLRENLTSLAVVHEATVCDALRARFERRCLYSRAGIVAVAFNPYDEPPTPGRDEILEYHEEPDERLEPHVFSVAEKAFRDLQRENRDQSIIFSGETGSGKTENAKLIISYLTTIDTKAIEIKDKILASLTVVEAFGHAETSKNENSSRFGKFFELQYNNDYNVVGAKLKTYLLDTSRVLPQRTQERSFHIFYQLSSIHTRFPFLQLNDRELAHLNSENPSETDEVNYSKAFDKTVSALNILGLSPKQQDEIWLILSAILHLGNVCFKRLGGPETNDNVESCLISNLHGLRTLVKLFSLDQKASQPLRKWLCHKRVLSHQDEVLQPMTVELATRNRDKLARFLYKKLFNWIVTQANASFRSPGNVQNFIGVLDVYGFENLGSNSFEQFCINYANEKIQQHCVRVIFKIEQEEYLREKIGWNFNGFHDNVMCLELIEGRGGIIELMDEETKKYVQTAKDYQISWIQQLHAKFEKSEHFSAWQEGCSDFVINHFVTSVRYNPKSFIEKNRDPAMRELVEVLKDSKSDLLRKIMCEEYSRLAPTGKERKAVSSLNRSKYSKKSILFGFRNSLAALTDTLSKTSPNFVICIKPNEEKKAWQFDTVHVLEQLHAFNITEIIRMSAAGFFKQQTYANFFQRYHCLIPFEKNERTSDKLRDNCLKILKMHAKIKDFSHIKFGKKKIFLREDDIVQLEDLRQRRQHRASIVIQKAFKGYLEVRRYWQLRRATVWVQNHARRCMRRRREQARAATKIQAAVRGYLTRRWYLRFVRSFPVFKMYASLRVAAIVKRDLQAQMLNAFATLIQTAYRGYVARRRYDRMRRSAVVIQAWVRGHLERKFIQKFREDQKKQENLEVKLDDLHVKINCLIEKVLSPEELDEMNQISDDTQFMRAKNKALNRVLFEKIETLKVLRGSPPNKSKHIPNGEMSKSIMEESPDEAAQKTPRKNEKKTCDLSEIVLNGEMSKSITEESPDETVQETPRKNEDKTCGLSKIDLSKEDPSEEEMPANEVSTAVEEEMMQIAPEKREEETCELVENDTVSSEETKSEDAQEVVQFDAIKAQEASALASQETPPKTNQTKKPKICSLPELDLNSAENYDEVEDYITNISANEVFKSIIFEENNDCCYIKVVDAYDKFDIRSEDLRKRLKLGDYELMKQKMLKRNSEISIHKLDKSTPKKVKSFIDIALDISYQRHQHPGGELIENYLVEERKKCLGMLQFNLKFTSPLIYHIVIDLQVSTILECNNPVMPATILFMCIRYVDSINNNHALVLMMHVYKRAVEGLVKNFKTFDSTVLWLANTHQLLNYLKQYSKVGALGWEQHHLQNTESQSEHHLRNLDVHLLYAPLHLIGVWIFKYAVKLAHMRVAQLVVPGILDTEHIIEDVTFVELTSEEDHKLYYVNHLYRLLKELTFLYDTCVKCGVSHRVVVQIFQQLFGYISDIALTNFLCRKGLCTNIKGALIRCNIRTIEQWAANRKLSKAIESLAPVVEAMRLLHLLPFTSAAVDDVLSCFTKLNYNQILKIISTYNPPFQLFTFDQQNIVQKLQSKIMENEALDNTIALNTSESIAVVLPFEYSPIHFSEIEIPKEFEVDVLELI